jgi:hypothetical protein
MAIPYKVQRLYRSYRKDTKAAFNKATDADVDALASLLGVPIPQEYREWITFMDNGLAGAGFLFTLKKSPPTNYSVYDVYDGYPQWTQRKLIPIADDGLGNKFVMIVGHTSRFNPIVLYYDAIGPDTPSCVVSSNLFLFLEHFFLEGLEKPSVSFWARGKEEVLARDPDLSAVPLLPFPWEPAEPGAPAPWIT